MLFYGADALPCFPRNNHFAITGNFSVLRLEDGN